MRHATGEEPGCGADAGGGERDAARVAEGRRPTAVRSIFSELQFESAMKRLRRQMRGARHGRFVALVDAHRVRANGAVREVRLYLGGLLGPKLAVDVGV